MGSRSDLLPTAQTGPGSIAQSSPVHILWLYNRDRQPNISHPLVRHFKAHHTELWLMDPQTLPFQELVNFDLLVVEEEVGEPASSLRLVEHVRLHSYVPMVVIANTTDSEWAIQLLEAGADAVLTTQVRPEVIVAHCQAILRRW
ncbi:MAG: response regulator transcription factor [Caldilineaceae bacterium]|nr:response regulator transcription factor [Caldilineaceae bacterium]